MMKVSEGAETAGEGTDTFIEVCTTSDIWIGEMEAFKVGRHNVLVVNVDGEFHAYDGRCPHQGRPLIHGELEDHVLTCRAHQWTFDVRSGKSINPSAQCLRRFPLRIEGDKVMVAEQPNQADASPYRHNVGTLT
jgi:nitrite reductase/ring-hydroxylating ferredoxin subunit